jgi:hypothetical protein
MSGVLAIVATYVARKKFDGKIQNSTLSADVESEATEYMESDATELQSQNDILSGDERRKMLNSICECAFMLTIFSLVEAVSFLDVLFIRRYNGKRGVNVKLLFYAFYPVHLLLLGLVCVILNI